MLHNCDLCGSAEHTAIDVAKPYIGNQDPPVVCMNCGFVYVRERRSPEEIAKAWDGIWGEGYSSAWPAVKARLTYVAEWLDETIGLEGKSVLEIGAGEGSFLDLVRNKGAYPVGIEPFGGNVEQIRAKDIFCHHGTAESIEAGKHDIVCLLWTLENTGDCIGVLKRARGFLNHGGIVVVATGSRILVPFKKPMSSYFSTNPMDTHCFRFSGSTLATAMCRAGLEHTEINRYWESDWMVMTGELPDGDSLVECYGDLQDDPRKVLQFFRSWEELFP